MKQIKTIGKSNKKRKRKTLTRGYAEPFVSVFYFGRGRRTWSCLSARSVLLLCRGLYRKPASFDTQFYGFLSSDIQIKKKPQALLLVYFLIIILLTSAVSSYLL